MEAAFEQIQKAGKNDVDSLVQWMKSSKVIESTEAEESKVKRMFSNAKDQKNIEFSKFKEVLETTAKEQNKTLDQITKMLTDAVPQVQGVLASIANAFSRAMGSKN